MAVDIIARSIAVNGSGGGGTGEGYTKDEVDNLLAQKQDLITLRNKLFSDLIEFNLTEEDIIRIHNEVKAELITEVEVDGDDIIFLTDVSTDEDDITIETESAFAYKNNIHL